MREEYRLSQLAGIAPPSKHHINEHDNSVWPLNVVLFLLGGAALGIAFYFLEPDDPRLVYSPWTYLVVTPIVLLLISTLLRTVVSQLIERSMQIAFMLSVLIHLLLLVYAVNVVIYSRMWPDVMDSLAVQREQLKRESLQAREYMQFQFSSPEATRPDHLRMVPTEVETPETVPDERRETLQMAQNELSPLASPSPELQRTAAPHLLQRQQPEFSAPEAAAQPAPLSRSELQNGEIAMSDLRPAPLLPESVPPELEASSEAARRRAVSEATSRADASAESTAELPQTLMVTPSDTELSDSRQARPRQAATSPRRAQAEPLLPELGAQTARASQPRAIAGGRTSRAAPPSASIAGPLRIDALDPNPSDRSTAPIDTRRERGEPRRSSAELSRPGELQSPSWDGELRLQTGVRGRSPLDLANDDASGEAAERDVADLSSVSGDITNSARGSLGSRTADGSQPAISDRVDLPENLNDRLQAAMPDSTADTGDGELEDESATQIRRGRSGPTASSPLALEVPAEPDPGGLSALPSESTTLLPKRRAREPAWTPPQLEPQRFARQEVGGPLATGSQVDIPKPAFQQRLDRIRDQESDRRRAVEPQTERAIERGLVFLAKNQRPDGAWRLQDFDTSVLIRSDTAATGLCLLAFQGAGYTHRQYQYAETVDGGLRFLIEHQKSDGDLYIPQDPASDQNAWLYSHGIATLALCEAYGMTQDPELREPAQKALDFMVASQDRSRGGWRYRPGVGSDTSVTGWFMMAFKSGQLADLDVPPSTFQRIESFIDRSQSTEPGEEHLYRYNPFAADTPQQRHGLQPTPVMTSVGLLMRLYLGWSREDEAMQAGAGHLLEHPPKLGSRSTSLRDTYYWYYATQVIFHMGGDYWRNWHDQLYPLLVDGQIIDGENAGSWDPLSPTPDLWARYGGRLYVTTMNLLSLEVSYRHLPLYEATAE